MNTPIYVAILAGLVFASVALSAFVLWDEVRHPDQYRGWNRR